MRQFRALDLYCGGGGATKGLQRAGFHVTGVDIRPQKRYCGDRFFQADALDFAIDAREMYLSQEDDNEDRLFDFIWASPPCQAYSVAASNRRRDGVIYPDLIAATRAKLIETDITWVMENVPGSPMRADVILCGSMFGLRIARHRVFESNITGWPLVQSCSHVQGLVTVCGHGTPSRSRHTRIARGLHPNVSVDEKRAVMDISWMNREELAQAVPPAYSEWIGRRAIEFLESLRSTSPSMAGFAERA